MYEDYTWIWGLVIVLLALIAMLAVGCIFSGVYTLLEGNIFDIQIPTWLSIVLISGGGVLIFFIVVFLIYFLMSANNNVPENPSINNVPENPSINNSLYIPDENYDLYERVGSNDLGCDWHIRLFSSMIWILQHRWIELSPKKGYYVYYGGNRIRTNFDFMEQKVEEEMNGIPEYISNFKIKSENLVEKMNNSYLRDNYDDYLAIYIYYLFKIYMKNKVNIFNYLNKVNEYGEKYKKLPLVKDLIRKDEIYVAQIDSLAIIWNEIFICLHKLNQRRFISLEVYMMISKEIRKVIEILFKINPDSRKILEEFRESSLEEKRVEKRHRPSELILLEVYKINPYGGPFNGSNEGPYIKNSKELPKILNTKINPPKPRFENEIYLIPDTNKY